MDESKRSGGVVRVLRAATAGAVSLLLQGMAPAGDGPVQPLVDRVRKRNEEGSSVADTAAQLVMEQSAGVQHVIGGHRSHRSHSSHYSSRGGGGGNWIPDTPAPAPAPQRVPVPSTLKVVTVPIARVSVDGKDVGVSPTPAIRVAGPKVTVTLTHKLRGTIQKVVDVTEGPNTLTIDW